jgi:Nif-specific regulatory protein
MVESKPVQKIRLVVQDGSGGPQTERTLTGPVIQVGRGAGNDLDFTDPRVSSVHGRIILESDRVLYQDMGSTNGSAVTRGDKRTVLTKDRAMPLEPGDQIQLGDADRPTSVRLEEIVRGDPSVHEATVVAGRALGEVAGLPEYETYNRLLQLLAEMRTETDTFSLPRKVLMFLVDALAGAYRAECYMQDSTGRFGPVLSLGADGSTTVTTPPSSSLLEKLCKSRQAMLVEDTKLHSQASDSIRTLPARSVLLAPLVVEEEVIGAIQLGAREGGVFVEADLDLCSVLAQQLSAVLSGVRLIERLREAEARLQGECEYLKEQLGRKPALEEMVGTSTAIMGVRRQIQAVAPSRTTILIQGETGVGKELVARAVHEQSPRWSKTFAAVNCSALAAGILESELFGHAKGAFTGAHRERKGLFEVAHQGTLFLDEIGDMPISLQPKLLRALEEGSILPVGSTKTRSADVRVVAATNRNLEEEVQAGRFRQDLLFRLNVFTLELPPLRKRRDDIIPLAEHFLKIFSGEHDRPHPGFTPEALAALQGFDWPGNIRELKNEMERASLLAPKNAPVDRPHLSERLGGGQALVDNVEGTLKDVMERLEVVVLQAALKQHDGNRTRCAKALGISRQALITKIAKFKLEG